MKIFNDIVAGRSLRTIADDLNDRKVVNRSGKRWTAGGLSQLLENPSLIGQRKYKKSVMKSPDGLPIVDKHLQILSHKRWSKLQDIFAVRSNRWKGEKHERLLLYGTARCGTCGGVRVQRMRLSI